MMTIINILCIIFLVSCVSVLYFLFSNNYDENINNYDCTITKNLGNGYYEVSIKTKNGIITKEVKSINNNKNISVGETFKIRKYYYGYFIYDNKSLNIS